MDQEIRYTKQGRPWPPPLSGGFWRNVRLASLALLLLLLALSTYFFLQAPAVMATKLTAEGEVAVYGSRWNFLLLPAVCLVVYGVMAKMLQRPDVVNFGRMLITETNYVEQYDLARKFVA